MQKVRKILILVVVVLLAVVGLVYWFQDKDALKIEQEDVPCNLAWGMSQEEVRTIMENAGYEEIEAPYSIAYKVYDFQGIEGVNGVLFLKFEYGKLYDAFCTFSTTSSYDELAISEEMLGQLREAFESAYKKQCEEILVVPDPLGLYDCYYLHRESLVNVLLNETHLYVSFMERNHATAQKIIEGLRVKQ